MPPSKRAAAAVVGGGGGAAAAATAPAMPTRRPPPIKTNDNNKRARRAPSPPPSPPALSSTSSSPPPPLPFQVPLPPPPLCSRTVPLALAHLRSADPRLAPLIDAHGERCAERLGKAASGEATATSTPPTFPRLVQTILAQQLSWKAASTIHRRLLVSAGVLSETTEEKQASSSSYERAALRLTPQRLLTLHEPQIRGAGVSGAKARALKDLAERYADGRLSDAMLRDAVTAAPEGLNAALASASPSSAPSSSCPGARAASALLAVKGVGPWSLDMVSMFVLGAPDVLPAGDLGVRKGLARLQGGKKSGSSSSLPDAAAAARIAAAWRPYRTVGSWLMWRLAEEA